MVDDLFGMKFAASHPIGKHREAQKNNIGMSVEMTREERIIPV